MSLLGDHVKTSFGKAIEFIKEHPQFKLKALYWDDFYVEWEWSSTTTTDATVTKLVKVTDNSKVEWTPTTKDLINEDWEIFTI